MLDPSPNVAIGPSPISTPTKPAMDEATPATPAMTEAGNTAVDSREEAAAAVPDNPPSPTTNKEARVRNAGLSFFQ
jgi:hypothetical protein